MTLVSIETLIAGAHSGHLVSFPTDTVPALAARPDRSALIFAAKERSQEKPLILMGATPEQLWPFVTGSQSELLLWRELTDKYWPGALTLVLPASGIVPEAMNPKDPTTIGIRIPDRKVACQILEETGPLATTSANKSGRPPLQTMTEIEAEFAEVLALDLMDRDLKIEGQTPSGLPSTVVKWTGNGWEILRKGSVRLEFLG